MAVGFVLNLNLLESDTREKDSLLLDNLAGAGISEDIALFSNNLRATDVILPNDLDTSDSTNVLSIQPQSSKIAFSNRTKVKYNNIVYTVVDSDGNKEFKLIDANDNYLIANTIEYPLIRSISIYYDNIKNVNPPRKRVLDLDDVKLQQLFDDQFKGLIATEIDQTSVYSDDITQYLSFCSDASGVFEISRSRTFFKIIPNESDDQLELYNSISVLNTNNEDVSSGTDAPGVYINTADGQLSRVGGSNINPWETSVGFTKTIATKTTLRNLAMSNPEFGGSIQIQPLGPFNTDPNAFTDFTHVIPAEINGQEFYLLAVEDTE